MISIDDFFEFDNSLIAKSQLIAVTQAKQLRKDAWGFHIIYWGKERLVGEWTSKVLAEAARTLWIKNNLKKPPSRVCTGCGMIEE